MPEIKDKKNVKVKKLNLDGKEVKLELKELPVQVKIVDEEQGIIEAYVSVFGNVDSYHEVVEKGAFADFLKENFPRYPKGVWAHDWAVPIAKTIEAREDERGLFIKGKLIKGVQKADEAYLLLKEGVITDFSFGFQVDEADVDPETGIRYLKKIRIYEWSPVLVGANPEAMLVGVKADGQEAEPKPDDETTPPDETPADPEPKPENEPAPEPAPADPAPEAPAEGNGGDTGDQAEALSNAIEALKAATEALEALKGAKEAPASAKAGGSAVDPRGRDEQKLPKAVKLIIRDARQADKAIGRLLFRAKNTL